MFKVNKIVSAIALCTSLAMSSYAVAKPDHGDQRQKMQRLFSQLSVTDTQKQDIRQIMKQGFADSRVNQLDKQAFKQQLAGLIRTSTWDAEAAQALLTDGQAQFNDDKFQRAANKNAIWNILTPEQQTQLDALKAERQANNEQNDSVDTEQDRKKKGKKGKKLNLSDEQKTAMAAIREAAKAESASLQTRLKAFKQAEKALIQSTDFSQEAWTALHDQYKSDFIAAGLIKTKAKHDSWNVLSEEQQAIALQRQAKEAKKGKRKGEGSAKKGKNKAAR